MASCRVDLSIANSLSSWALRRSSTGSQRQPKQRHPPSHQERWDSSWHNGWISGWTPPESRVDLRCADPSASSPSALCLCLFRRPRRESHFMPSRQLFSVIPPPWSGGTADYCGSLIQQSSVGSSQSVGSPPACTKKLSVSTFPPHPNLSSGYSCGCLQSALPPPPSEGYSRAG